jgi:alpha-1,6-mannosyltransferase
MKGLQLILVGLMGAGFFFLSAIPRSDFGLTGGLFFGLFAVLVFLFIISKQDFSWKKLFLVGLIMRIVVSFSAPQWSDDYYRFLWDGNLLELGHNPYLDIPREFIEEIKNPDSDFLSQLYPKLNSPDYYSVYPPLNQVVFWLAAKGSGGSVWHGILILRLVLILAEIATFLIFISLFRCLKIQGRQLFWYWLNPLVIMEVAGNLHFEGLILLLLLVSILAIETGKTIYSGSFWGLAIGLKLLPLILAPSFLFNQKASKSFGFWLGAGLAVIGSLGWLLWDSSFLRFMDSLSLYQGKFEFNASVYYLLREIGFWIQGYNTIAFLTKMLSALSLVLIFYLSWEKRPSNTRELVDLMVGIYLVYLLLQPVVHPWYILPGLGLSVLSGRLTFLFWSFGLIFSYQAYGNLGFRENPIFLILEYSFVGMGISLDYFLKKRNPKFST